MESEKLFDNKALKRLIIPLMFEQLLAILVGLVDTVMVARAGEEAVSGVALVDNINRLIIQVMSALATGGAVICSQYIGKGIKREAKKAAAQLEFLMAVTTIVLMGICLVAAGFILRVIFGDVEPSVMSNAILYLKVTSLSYPFLGLYNVGAAIFRSNGNSKISLNISIIMNVINIIGNAIFVIGLHKSVFGVALATDISRVVAGLIMTACVISSKNPIRIDELKMLLPDMTYIRKILFIGIPSGIENGLFQVGKIMVVSMVASMGTTATAANAVGFTIIDFANIPGSAMGLALITVVGRCMGAKRPDEAVSYTKKMIRWAYYGAWICNTILFFTCPYIALVFNLTSGGKKILITVLRAFAVTSLFIWPLSFTMPNSLRSAGDVRFTMIVSIFSMLIFRVGASFLFGIVLGVGVLGVWIGMFIDWGIRSFMFTMRFASKRWLKRGSLV